MSISALRFDRASRFTALALLAVAAACSKVNETRPSIDLEPLLSWHEIACIVKPHGIAGQSVTIGVGHLDLLEIRSG